MVGKLVDIFPIVTKKTLIAIFSRMIYSYDDSSFNPTLIMHRTQCIAIQDGVAIDE